MRFQNKSVIITGGGGKIGKAYAMGFAKEGAKVALPDIASADHVVKAIKDMGGTAISMACDVSDEKSVKAMVDQVAKEFGSVDVLVNNAAYFMTVKKSVFWEMAVDEFDKAMADHDEAIRLNPTFAMVYQNRAGLWVKAGATTITLKHRASNHRPNGCLPVGR
jgi:NAD(P)-dependent dehydrogenase (short-subunit alcohol dehydrogenase family)